MVLYILVFFAVAAPIVVYLSLNYYRESVEKSVEEQQSMLVSRIADELDQKIIFSQDTLISASNSLSPKIIASPFRAEEFLYNNLALISIFDNGVFLFTPAGKLIAETSQKPGRIGMDFSYREYMKRTLTTKRPVISPPFISSMSHHHPAVMFTVPILDDSGKLLAVFGGSIDLMKPNFLGTLSEAKIGKNGYFQLSTADHITIIHPEKDRIMAQAPSSQVKLYDKAIREFEGSGMTLSASGTQMISAFRRLKTVDWALSANYPENEALEPIRGATRFAWLMVFFGGILTGVVFWLVTRQLISPLISITEQIRMIHADEDHTRKVEISTNDEIRELATVFNGLISDLDEKERNLRVVNEELELRVAERTQQLEQTNRMLQIEIENSEAAQEEITCLNEDLSCRALSLETINRELESFSYSISHDLRAPVRHIKGYINILQEDHASKFDDEVVKLFKRISASSSKLEQLISDILDLSRVSLTEISNVSVNLSIIANEVACILRENEPGRLVEFDIEDGVTLTGDPALLQLVIQNLLENAWKYSARSASPLIRFGKIQSGNETTCFVSDNGIGFDMANADLIFGVFQRLHSSVDYEGSGIGLATVQRIIHRHGGRIWAEGGVDKGATFYFSIPQS
jgi:signal transduction histidine kinase